MDVLGAANYIRAQTLRTYELLLAIAIIYVVLAFVIEKGVWLSGTSRAGPFVTLNLNRGNGTRGNRRSRICR